MLWVETMEKEDVKPNIVTYMALIRALSTASGEKPKRPHFHWIFGHSPR